MSVSDLPHVHHGLCRYIAALAKKGHTIVETSKNNKDRELLEAGSGAWKVLAVLGRRLPNAPKEGGGLLGAEDGKEVPYNALTEEHYRRLKAYHKGAPIPHTRLLWSSAPQPPLYYMVLHLTSRPQQHSCALFEFLIVFEFGRAAIA